jgi:hypothetical protein
VSSQNPRHERVSNLVLYPPKFISNPSISRSQILGLTNDDSLNDSRSDEELILDIHKVLAQLNRLDVRVLNTMFSMRDTVGPRSDRATDLDLAGADDALFLQLARGEVGSGEEEGHLDGVVLRAQEVVPSEGDEGQGGDEGEGDEMYLWTK